MKDLLKKAGSIGKELADSVKDTMENFKGEKGFLVEKFADEEHMAKRFNTLQENFADVTVQAVCKSNDYFVAIIKIEE